jgi:DNA-binding transcriptional ArsR family regulator
MLDVLVIDRPEQLKALGHPLRLRVLEMLGEEAGTTLTCTSTCACCSRPG